MSVFVTFLEMMAWLVFSSLARGSLAALATPSGGRGIADLLRGTLSRLSERARLRLAAASLDLGCRLMLCEEERRARRLARRLSGLRARRSGLKTAALRAGARRSRARRRAASLESRAGWPGACSTNLLTAYGVCPSAWRYPSWSEPCSPTMPGPFAPRNKADVSSTKALSKSTLAPERPTRSYGTPHRERL